MIFPFGEKLVFTIQELPELKNENLKEAFET